MEATGHGPDARDARTLGVGLGMLLVGMMGLDPFGNQVTCEAAETSCSDGFDSDGDTLIDCTDPDCNGIGNCSPALHAAWSPALKPIVRQHRKGIGACFTSLHATLIGTETALENAP